MDRLINNECVVIYSVLASLSMDVNIIDKLYLFVVLTSDKAIRERLVEYTDYHSFIIQESSYYHAINRKFGEFQPMFLNAMTMLLLGGKIEKKDNGEYDLTVDGESMLLDIINHDDRILSKIRLAVINLRNILGATSTKTLYKDLNIVL